jgi:hypothetical protein
MEDHVHIQLGNRHVWGGVISFSFTLADRRAHVYVIGKTEVDASASACK